MKIHYLEKMCEEEKKRLIGRSSMEIENAEEKVRGILKEIREKGEEAAAKYNNEFDNYGGSFIPSPSEYAEAAKETSPALLKALKHSIKNVEKFHRACMPKSFMLSIEKGVKAGRRVVPLESAGLYIPGGKAIYPSVLIMLGVAAKVAGVKKIYAAIPPKACKGAMLVVAKILGIKIFKIGGVQAIGAFAYGTKTIPKVEVIAGPGNPFVSAAQKIIRAENKTKIEFIPGPSEGMVFAEESDNAKFAAADVLSEAEHGPDSAGILVTTSEQFAKKVQREIPRVLRNVPKKRKNFILENSKKYSAIIIAKNPSKAIEFINEYAPEHLVIYNKKYLGKIRNAGTICVGKYSSITAGNFIAGPNAILPTNSQGKIYSGISVDTFLKKPTIEWLSEKGLKGTAQDTLLLSDYEGFPMHSHSIRIRLEKGK